MEEAADAANVSEDFVNVMIAAKRVEYFLDEGDILIIQSSWERLWGIEPMKAMTVAYVCGEHGGEEGGEEGEGESESGGHSYGVGEMSEGMIQEINDILENEEDEDKGKGKGGVV